MIKSNESKKNILIEEKMNNFFELYGFLESLKKNKRKKLVTKGLTTVFNNNFFIFKIIFVFQNKKLKNTIFYFLLSKIENIEF